MTSRESLHQMIDQLPDAELEALEEWLRVALRQGESLRLAESSFTEEGVESEAPTDRVGLHEFNRVLDEAPEDDEPLSDEEVAALRRWRESPGPTVPHAEVKRMLRL